MPPRPTNGPLQGIRVLDLTWVLSGPFCTLTLCDLGADVIKVERPPYGDVSRTTGPIVDGESGYFFSVNRGKRSMALDLTSDEGKELFLRLVREADVVVENFTPGKMEALGLGYPQLSEVNPRLIYAAISGYGQTGPMREKPALEIPEDILTYVARQVTTSGRDVEGARARARRRAASHPPAQDRSRRRSPGRHGAPGRT